MIFEGAFQPKAFCDGMLVILSFICSVQVSLEYHKHPGDFWTRSLTDFTFTSGKKTKFGGMGQA